MTLPANSTFLPVLDDLLSPDLRPVLQTPTADFGGLGHSLGGGATGRTFGGAGFANVTSTGDTGNYGYGGARTQKVTNSNKKLNFKGKGIRTPEEELATRKIQTWWRKRCHSIDVDIGAERAKHALRHNRTEEHVHYLESEVTRLKSALSSERKARSLQMDAIRSLWSQVQQMSSSSNGGGGGGDVMSMSMPSQLANGLLSSPPKKLPVGQGQMSMSFAGTLPPESSSTCTANCSKEIQLLRESMSSEIASLRDMITSLNMSRDPAASKERMEVDDDQEGRSSVIAVGSGTGCDGDTVGSLQAQRPFSLNIVGMTSSVTSGSEMETPEITQFAGVMAKNVLETAVESESINELPF